MRSILLSLPLVCMICACQAPSERLNAPPHGEPAATSDLQGNFEYMTDNALLEDMNVSDMHFMPHRPQLNMLGEERMARLVSLMEAFGGTIRLSSDVEDEALRAARLQTLTQYLASVGLSTTAETVCEDLPGGRGMEATEAVLIRVNEGTYAPKKGSGGSSSGGGAPTTSTGSSGA